MSSEHETLSFVHDRGEKCAAKSREDQCGMAERRRRTAARGSEFKKRSSASLKLAKLSAKVALTTPSLREDREAESIGVRERSDRIVVLEDPRSTEKGCPEESAWIN